MSTPQALAQTVGGHISQNSALIESLSAAYRGKCAARTILSNNISQYRKSHKPLLHTLSDEKGISSQELGSAIDSLATVFSQIKKSSEVCRATELTKMKTLNQITSLDLMMIPSQTQAQASVEETNNVEAELDESLFSFDYSHSSGKTLQMQVAELRQRPEILRKFQADIDAHKKKQLKEEQDRQTKLRLQHRELMRSLSCAQAAKPIIENFRTHNKRLIELKFYSPEARYTRLVKQGEELDIHIDDIYNRRDSIDYALLNHKLQSMKKSFGKPILPQTFIKQRTELGTFVGFTSKMALLFQVASNFCEIRRNNDYMARAATIIQYFYRTHRDSLKYKKVQESARRIQRMALAFLNRKRRQRRQTALGNIKRFLLGIYIKNTWASAVIMHINSAGIILQELRVYRKRKLARLELISLLLHQIDREDSFRRIRNTRYKAHLHELAHEANKKKKPGEGTKKAPVQQTIEAFNPSPEDLEEALLSTEALGVIARIYLTAAVQIHQYDLDTFSQDSRNKEIDLPAFLLLPSYACSSALLTVARDNLPEFRIILSEYLNNDLGLLDFGPRYPDIA